MTLPAQAESRRRNLAAVLRLLHVQGPTRQVDISDELRLNRSTGISLVDELEALGLVDDRAGGPSGHRGRPSRMVLPSHDIVVVAAEIAAESARVDIVGLGGTPLVGEDLPILPSSLGPDRTLCRIVAAISALLSARPELRVVGSAAAVHGAVDDGRRVVFAPNLGWAGAHVGALDAMLTAALPRQRVPAVVVGNDADMGALGEQRRGAGRNHRDFLYLSAERGIGGGLVANGELLLGSSGLAGEVGHLKVGPGARKCGCGQHGCWETEIGSGALRRRGNTVESIATWFGRGLGLLIPILQPAVVIVGGHLTDVVIAARPFVDAAIFDACPPELASEVKILPSQLGPDAALIGAAEIAFDHLLRDPARLVGPVRSKPDAVR